MNANPSNPTEYLPLAEVVGPDGPLHWESEWTMRWKIRNRHDNGYRDAFVKSGERWLIHVPSFMRSLDKLRGEAA